MEAEDEMNAAVSRLAKPLWRILIANITAGAGRLQAAAALEKAWCKFRPEETIIKRISVF
jgi:hypothetical protein